jgi:hypothetical protein
MRFEPVRLPDALHGGVADSPWAIVRTLQCVPLAGLSCAVLVMILSLSSSQIGFLPARLPLPLSRALTPLIWEHVNPYGRFEIDMATRLPLD